jgi:hypothetical protein
MLTLMQYKDLWTTVAPNGFGQAHAMPSYDEYVIRENQYQDYLDIFRGRSTRLMRGLNAKHPYQEYLNPENPPCIKKIMIGEAAPPLNPIINPLRDAENFYFYNTHHVGSTGYFIAPCTAFNIEGQDKANKLFDLAIKGVLLIDLFPFAVTYSTTFRNRLCNRNVVRSFWDGENNPYSIENRIMEISELLCKVEVKLAFIAPPTISHYIAQGINNQDNVWPTFGCNHRQGLNAFNPEFDNIRGKFYSGIPLGSEIIGINGNYYPLPTAKNRTHCIQVPIYACCCYDGSGQRPHELFIRNAFGLPSNQNQI